MDEIKLMPCPFCGNENVRLDRCKSSVMCPKCFAKGPMISRFLKGDRTETEAAAIAWNTRSEGGIET